MKFDYEYRTSDNALHTGVVCARNRDDAYSELRKQGIRPASLVESPGFFNKLIGRGKRWLAIGFLSVLCVTLVVIIRSTPTPSSYTSISAPRHQIYGDPAIVAEWERVGHHGVFSHPGEQLLAYYAQPGAPVPEKRLQPKRIAGQIAACLTNRIAFVEGEPREFAEIKRIVNGIKDEFRAYLADGVGTPETFALRLNERQREEQNIYLRVANEVKSIHDPALLAERNAQLRALGLKPLFRP